MNSRIVRQITGKRFIPEPSLSASPAPPASPPGAPPALSSTCNASSRSQSSHTKTTSVTRNCRAIDHVVFLFLHFEGICQLAHLTRARRVTQYLHFLQLITALHIPLPHSAILASTQDKATVRGKFSAVYVTAVALHHCHMLARAHIPPPHRAIPAP